MSTLPKPQRKPKETPTVAHRTLSSRAAVRSLVESTCCRAGAHGWVCARRGRPLNDPSPEAGASPYQRRASQRAGTGLSLVTLGPFMGMRAADGQGGSCPRAVLALIGAPMTPGGGHAIWVRSSIP
uniref:Protein F n=1 Tax=Hepacivirus hominis TaxID=3052230 RepID=A0A4Y5PUH0_9HEPC|nr:protein F [Hepacivirus hominis]